MIQRKKVRCVEDNLVFQNLGHAAKYYMVKPINIRYVCEGTRRKCLNKTYEWVPQDHQYYEIPKGLSPEEEDAAYKISNLEQTPCY
jgi:hypothetical protein